MSTIFNNLTGSSPLNNYDGWEEVGAYDDNKINKIQVIFLVNLPLQAKILRINETELVVKAA